MKPLNGITIVEFSTMVTASLASMMMAEQGARVVKVEPVDEGDPMRDLGSQKNNISGLFASCNRGKQSVSLNLKDASVIPLVKKLLSSADVLISNFRPGVMASLGLDSAELRAENPRLVYMAITGFGTQGPLSAAPAYDPVIQAHAGFTASQGGQQPEFIRNLMCDKITAYTACQAVTAALYQRSQTGEGQHIDVSMLDAGLFFIFPDGFMNHTLLEKDIEPRPLLSDLIYDLTLTKDGAVTISALTDEQRAGVAKTIGMESLAQDERFNTRGKIILNIKAYKEIIAPRFLKMTTDEVMQKLIENDVPSARCLNHDEVLSQEQVVANNSVTHIEHPVLGKMLIVLAPPRFGGEQLAPASFAPVHGEHTQQVLLELGVDQQAYKKLQERGAAG